MSLLQSLISIQVSASVVMLLAWGVQTRTKDATAVDVVWACSIFAATCFLLLKLGTFDLRHVIIASLAMFWSLRLSIYLFLRMHKSKQEDSRYKTMRSAMGERAQLGFLIFYQVQALFVTIFVTPIAVALMTTESSLTLFDFIAIALFVIAITGESIADRQLMRFKALHQGKNKTCNVGLWRYSRHPNYFFEWIHWFAYPLFSYNSEYFWISCLAPFVMLIFLLRFTGIPHVEREALKNKPDYKAYMQSTSMFIPWFKK